MVLPHRIELWTSSLPMRCSTTELRQRERAQPEWSGANAAETAIGLSQAQGECRGLQRLPEIR